MATQAHLKNPEYVDVCAISIEENQGGLEVIWKVFPQALCDRPLDAHRSSRRDLIRSMSEAFPNAGTTDDVSKAH